MRTCSYVAASVPTDRVIASLCVVILSGYGRESFVERERKTRVTHTHTHIYIYIYIYMRNKGTIAVSD